MTEDIFVAFPIVFTAEINYWETAKTQAVMDNDLKKGCVKSAVREIGLQLLYSMFLLYKRKASMTKTPFCEDPQRKFPNRASKNVLPVLVLKSSRPPFGPVWLPI